MSRKKCTNLATQKSSNRILNSLDHDLILTQDLVSWTVGKGEAGRTDSLISLKYAQNALFSSVCRVKMQETEKYGKNIQHSANQRNANQNKKVIFFTYQICKCF